MTEMLKLLFGNNSEDLTPTTHKLEWFDINDSVVTEFKVNSFTHGSGFRSLIKINITLCGNLVQKRGIPAISKIHVSERFIRENGEQIAIVELCPIVLIQIGNSTPENGNFKVTCQLDMSTWQWGKNKIRIIAGEHTQEITAYQTK